MSYDCWAPSILLLPCSPLLSGPAYCPPPPLLPEPEHSPAAGHQLLIMSLQLLRKHRESAGVRGLQAGIWLSTRCCENAPERGADAEQSSGWPFRAPPSTGIPQTDPHPEGSWSLDVGCRAGKVGAAQGRKVWGPGPLRKMSVGMGTHSLFGH